MFVYLCPLYVKTAEPIGPKFCLSPGKVYEPAKCWYSLFLKMLILIIFENAPILRLSTFDQLRGKIVNDKRKRINPY